MKIAVTGLWHLGCVTAACSAAAGHQVVAWDPRPQTIEALRKGEPPVAEPGLAELIAAQIATARLRFTSRLEDAVRGASVVWVTFDTPVDEEDRADTSFVKRQVEAMFPHLDDGVLVLSSSQLPVGSIRALEDRWASVSAGKVVHFAVSPENLRLGKAIEVFTQPDRVIVGVRDERAKELATQLFEPITSRIEWMSVESAEMTKHAINAFLATSVTFINEIASLCEAFGADAKEVERGLKTERRIGPAAYLSPGAAFAGGTLARDVTYLRELGRQSDRATPLMDGVLSSNVNHRGWALQRLGAELGSLKGRRIAVWGLTYKPGTDTLRRSAAVELCVALMQTCAEVAVHDPVVRELPASLRTVHRASHPLAASQDAEALVVATEWPEYRRVDVNALVRSMKRPLVIDANRFLEGTIGQDARVRLISVGRQ